MADLLCGTRKNRALAIFSRMAHSLLLQRIAKSRVDKLLRKQLRELGGLHGKHGGHCDQKISFYFIFAVDHFFYLARLELSTVNNGTVT